MFGNRSILIEAPRPELIRRSPRAPWLAVSVVCFGAFMGQLDASIVTLTFRPMQHDFGAPLAAVQWVSLAYLLALVALLAPAGRIADAIGRKLVYGYGFILFAAASAACGLAPSLGLLVVFRLVQAAGAAMLQANSVALVTTSVPPARMRLALSVQAAAQAMGLGLGPTLGGLLAETAGWRAVYWINVPVGCVAVIASRYLLPRTRQLSRGGSFDWPGAVLLAAATSAAAARAVGRRRPAAARLGRGGLAAGRGRRGGGLCRARDAYPFPADPACAAAVRPGWPWPSAARSSGISPCSGRSCSSRRCWPPGPVSSGPALVLSALPAGFGAAALGGEALLPAAMTNRARGSAGALISSFALVMLIFMPLSPAWIGPLLALAGFGLGVFVPANNAVIMRTAPPGSASVLGGLVNMARGIGTTFGIALVTLALHLAGPGPAGRPSATLALAVLAAAAAAAALIAAAIRPLAGAGLRPPETGPSGAFG